MTKLVLGTAQFGLDYGITNHTGKVHRNEAAGILNIMHDAGAILLDTAADYGDAEALIGALPEAAPFGTITKIAPAAPEEIMGQISRSLERLRRTCVHALMLRDVSLLLGKDGNAFWTALEAVKTAGFAKRIGVSVYMPDELEDVADRFPLNIVQLPLNVIDRRFLAWGGLPALRARGIEVHARSILMQGLLVAAPGSIAPSLARLGPAIVAFHNAAKREGLSPLAAAIGYVSGQRDVDNVIVGVTTANEAREVVEASNHQFAGEGLPWSPANDLPVDPRLWEAS